MLWQSAYMVSPPRVAPLQAAPLVTAEVRDEPRRRLDSVDLLRGAVMVLMALDHVRDYFTRSVHLFDPTDLTRTTAGLFLTRWITHFCAPTFIFLAGASAFLYGSRPGRSRSDLAGFLLSRGLWLVLIELTVVRLAWSFNFDYHFFSLQVIWAIGWSMVALAALVFLPIRLVGVFGVVMIATHNLLDGITAAPLVSAPGMWAHAGVGDWLWSILHVRNPPVVYPLIPWIGVMAAGYAFGPLLRHEPAKRRRELLQLGGALVAAFLLLRAVNVYGDVSRWSVQPTGLFTVFSFVNATKYPPSLLYLLMTLGPAILSLALLESARGPVARFFIVYGRVPFLYYVAHLYLIHALVVATAALRGDPLQGYLTFWRLLPASWGYGLGVTYLVWAAVVVALYPLCRWFAGVKARRRDAWLSYL
jgi:uncharacterized membrane protein